MLKKNILDAAITGETSLWSNFTILKMCGIYFLNTAGFTIIIERVIL